MFIDLLHGEIQSKIDFLPDSFLSSKSKRQIDPIKGHPIDIFFPIFPLPPCRSITQSAHILIISKSVQFVGWVERNFFFFAFLTSDYLSTYR